ncbi:hypothetical protein ACFQ1S_13725 [Kibdelosporangium lantanae]|uniref:Uncharacterized protein n=1 Tax=Kibdelosporangium lantanae TaxID=1497396 RepID=A0ABW3M7G1_9PSEU
MTVSSRSQLVQAVPIGWAAAEVFGFLQPGGHIEDAYSMAQQGYVFVMVLGIHLTAGAYLFDAKLSMRFMLGVTDASKPRKA